MATENYYKNITHVVELKSDIGVYCKHCDRKVSADDLAGSINHYIKEHAYKLLHIGSDTSRDDQGLPWHSTIAILGK